MRNAVIAPLIRNFGTRWEGQFRVPVGSHLVKELIPTRQKQSGTHSRSVSKEEEKNVGTPISRSSNAQSSTSTA
jgi:hypothetical protein